ncbi:MAG: hypothetical protein M9920_01195 [Verrucomicrobiae bacterium]|nr:hypothetical protein [Verrucomicrobiae bacterium]
MRVEEGQESAFITCDSCSHEFYAQSGAASSRRITLTRAQLKMPEIEEFVVLLVGIASDGVLEYEELQKLTEWLNSHIHLEVPAVRFMVDLMIRICADGKITEEEIFEVQLAIERVLPKEYRSQITEARKTAYYDQPATANQLDAIESITYQRPIDLNRRQASELLSELFLNSPASNRQIMFLRFWNRVDLATKSRREISEWIDSFTHGDEARWLAWDLFKEESGDDGSQRDPLFVPIGAGEKYLERVYRNYR